MLIKQCVTYVVLDYAASYQISLEEISLSLIGYIIIIFKVLFYGQKSMLIWIVDTYCNFKMDCLGIIK